MLPPGSARQGQTDGSAAGYALLRAGRSRGGVGRGSYGVATVATTVFEKEKDMHEVPTVEAALEAVESMVTMHEGALYKLATDLGEEEMLRLVLAAYGRQFDLEAREPKSITVQW